jgi:hypothetical protein
MPSHRGLDQLDGREHVGVDRLDPGIAVPVAEVAGRRAAGIGDHDVPVLAALKHRSAALDGGDVHGQSFHRGASRHLRVGPQPLYRRLQHFGTTRHHQHMHAFAGKRLRAAPAQPLARAANQRPFACNSEIHGVFLRVSVQR